MPATLRCTRSSRSTSAPIGRRCSRCGARTIPSSCRRAPRRSSATIRAPSSASSTRVTSRWKRMLQRSRRRSAPSSHPESVPIDWRTGSRSPAGRSARAGARSERARRSRDSGRAPRRGAGAHALADGLKGRPGKGSRPQPEPASWRGSPMSRTMKAVIIDEHGGPEVMTYREVEMPGLQPGQVRLAMRACSLNYHDLLTRRGMPGVRTPLPMVLGCDCAGVIAEIAPDVEGWELGEVVLADPIARFHPKEDPDPRVVIKFLGDTRWGGYAEYVVVWE